MAQRLQRIKNWLRRRASQHWTRALLGLIVLSAISFIPASLTSKADRSVKTLSDYPAGEDGVTLVGNIYNVDWSNTQKVTVLWSICGEGKYQENGPGIWYVSKINDLTGLCVPPNIPVDVYINNASAPVFSYDPIILPSEQMDDTSYTIYADSYFGFSVDHPLTYLDSYNAPFDSSYFTAVAFAIDKRTNESVPLTYFQASNGIPGDFSISSYNDTTSSTINLDKGSGPTKIGVQSNVMLSTLTHSHTARALTCSLLAINWILTLCSIFTTSLLFRHNGSMGDGVALLPLTVILTIPAIRALYVGSPRFGIFLDLVGFFPQMLTVVVCTVVVFSGIVVKNVQEGKKAANAPTNDGLNDLNSLPRDDSTRKSKEEV